MASSPQIPGFNAASVRAGLRLAMTVGLPPIEQDQPTFYFAPTSVTASGGASLDEEGVPFAPTTAVTRVTPPPVQVPCAVEYHDGSGKLENFGVIAASKIVLTLLDEDYDQVEGFFYVVIGGQRYYYRRTENPTGLVSLGLYTVHCESEDQG